jgi:hypothetical protein
MNALQISLAIFDILLFIIFLLGFNYIGILIAFKDKTYRPLVRIITISTFILFDILILAIIYYSILHF